MSFDRNLLCTELRRDEGVRYIPYRDTHGIQTVGVGHNLAVNPLPQGWKYPLTDAQIDQLLQEDIDDVIKGLDNNLSWWRDNLTDVRQRAIINMGFNLGITGLMGFANTLIFIRKGSYQYASDNMLKSRWAGQVGNRAKRLAYMVRTDSCNFPRSLL